MPLPVFPHAAPGIRLRVEPFEGFEIQAAVLDGNVAPGLTPEPFPNAAASTEFNRRGTHWALRRDEAALWAGEISYRFNQVPVEELSATRTSADATPIGAPAAPVVAARDLCGILD